MAPRKKFRAGSISCAIWENEININGRAVPILKTTVERRYKDKDGTWKSSGSFSRNKIRLAVYCLSKAFEAMIGEQQGNDDVEVGLIVGGYSAAGHHPRTPGLAGTLATVVGCRDEKENSVTRAGAAMSKPCCWDTRDA